MCEAVVVVVEVVDVEVVEAGIVVVLDDVELVEVGIVVVVVDVEVVVDEAAFMRLVNSSRLLHVPETSES